MSRLRPQDPGDLELIVIYAGKGKGKTSACVGQAMRACGAGLRVAFGQFIKRDNVAGEQKMLSRFPEISFLASGHGFLRSREDLTVHKAKARALLEWASKQDVDMLILDEALNALAHGLLFKNDFDPWLKAAGNFSFHLVLSGKKAPSWLENIADTQTEMLEVRHQYNKGIKALPGLEY